MKTPYSFSVLRYVHDIVTGEFVNVGVVLFAPQVRFLGAICSPRYSRLTKMFSNIDGEHYRQTTGYFQAKINEEGERLISELPLTEMPDRVTAFASRILPLDDSTLQFSPEGYGITEKPEETLEQLYNRHVEKYSEKTDRASRTDDEVWRFYKKTFEEKHILSKLSPHQIIGRNYDYEFKYSAKNGKWHLQEPISFDLLEASSITDKANSWLGRITSLLDGGEPFKLNILLGRPRDEKLYNTFGKAQNILHSMQCEHQFIKEDEAESFAEELKREIAAPHTKG